MVNRCSASYNALPHFAPLIPSSRPCRAEPSLSYGVVVWPILVFISVAIISFSSSFKISRWSSSGPTISTLGRRAWRRCHPVIQVADAALVVVAAVGVGVEVSVAARPVCNILWRHLLNGGGLIV